MNEIDFDSLKSDYLNIFKYIYTVIHRNFFLTIILHK